jgi:hypothetical protein
MCENLQRQYFIRMTNNMAVIGKIYLTQGFKIATG